MYACFACINVGVPHVRRKCWIPETRIMGSCESPCGAQNQICTLQLLNSIFNALVLSQRQWQTPVMPDEMRIISLKPVCLGYILYIYELHGHGILFTGTENLRQQCLMLYNIKVKARTKTRKQSPLFPVHVITEKISENADNPHLLLHEEDIMCTKIKKKILCVQGVCV